MAGRDFVRAGALSYVPSYHLETLKGLVAAHPGAETGHVQIIGRGGMQRHVSGAKRSISGARRKVSGSSRLKSCGFAAMERKFRSKAERDKTRLSNFLKCNNAFQAF
jgi:hypothetical protein